MCQGVAFVDLKEAQVLWSLWVPAFGRQREFVWTQAEGLSEAMQHLLDCFVLTGKTSRKLKTPGMSVWIACLSVGRKNAKMCVEMEWEWRTSGFC